MMSQMQATMARVRLVLGILLFGALAACSIPTATPVPDGQDDDAGTIDASIPPRPERVLFIGNSYTAENDLPAAVKAIAAESQAPIETDATLIGGATLYDHLVSTGAKEKLAGGKFDAVVLQGQSLEALGGESGFETVAPRFADQAKAAGSRVVWFATWARGPGASSHLRGESVANRIEQAYSKVALTSGGKVARVGAAFHQAQIFLPKVQLHQPDDSHPTKEGTLLAACTIVHTLTGKVPRVPEPAPLGIASNTAQALCNLAANVRCLEGGDLCDGLCFKLQTDTRHCGKCGNTCAAGDPCTVGQCGCAAGLKACSLTCTNLQYDRYNCGACGNRCEPDRGCSSGACTCGGSAVLPVTLPMLTALQPACTAAGQAACDRAGKQYCLSRGCALTGFGPASGHAPSGDNVMCLVSPAPVAVDYSMLQTLEPTCDGVIQRHSEACVTAVHRYCKSQGKASGFGHHEATGTQVSVTCLSSSQALALTVEDTTLQEQASRCVPHSVTCNAAAWNLCTGLGMAAGFGPVEASGNLRTVVCIRK